MLLVLIHQRWKACGAAAADASSQGMDLEDLAIDIFTERLIYFSDESLKMFKSGVGDVRTPRLWYGNAARIMIQIEFLGHPLGGFVFLLFEGTTPPNSVVEGTEQLGGIIGRHADDSIGGGVDLDCVAKDGWEQGTHDLLCFFSRFEPVFSHHGYPACAIAKFRKRQVVAGRPVAKSQSHPVGKD